MSFKKNFKFLFIFSVFFVLLNFLIFILFDNLLFLSLLALADIFVMFFFIASILEKEEKYIQELKKFKLAVENAGDHIVITDPDGKIIFANDAVERITGFSVEEIINKKAGVKELWGGQMSQEFYKKLWKTIKEDKKTFSGEILNKRKGGEKYSAFVSISPVLSDKGEVTYFIGIERDITEQKQLEEAKIKIETFLRSIGDGLVVTDQDGKITFVNQSAESLLMLPEATLLGRTIVESLPLYNEKGEKVPVLETPQVRSLVEFKKIVLRL
jgi:PAS domain S-box-containing protein